ncbi:hypothetical protein HUT16_13315 [Kitasatospora sp. NA04385]|uniref:hypothetical protein n=1 Tax=Kitasatospora sp. NA04385 TaxID=2742135 RepID=UPI001592719A|nr:hypothetical protein [Kitasatospora sp. NA04385]QKW19907.1 hypothetical protein HUT16_13315 [Kitasatospora sp. NA04385]
MPAQQRTDGTDPGDAAARARWIGDTLGELTGRRALVEESGDGGFRITLRLVEQPGHRLAEEVLRTLHAGDRFGHTSGDRWERLWVEVDAPEAEPFLPPLEVGR